MSVCANYAIRLSCPISWMSACWKIFAAPVLTRSCLANPDTSVADGIRFGALTDRKRYIIKAQTTHIHSHRFEAFPGGFIRCMQHFHNSPLQPLATQFATSSAANDAANLLSFFSVLGCFRFFFFLFGFHAERNSQQCRRDRQSER